MSASSRRSRWRTKLVVALVSTLATFGCAELALRWLLFGTSATAQRLGGRLREPALFAAPESDDGCKLHWLFLAPGVGHAAVNADAQLGWRGAFRAGDFAHADEALIGTRRPVLLFGDSFAECATIPELCFQSLLAESELSSKYCLLNYGCKGYGLDQIWLTIQGALERFADRDPIVIVGILVDDDLTRTTLSFFGWPKPELVVRDGLPTPKGKVDTDPARFLEQHPVGIESYTLALLARQLAIGEAARAARQQARARELSVAILASIESSLSERGLEHFYLLFCGQGVLATQPGETWSEGLLLDEFAARKLPVLSTRPFFEHAAREDARGYEGFFGTDGFEFGHYNEAGNRIAFVALRQGLERRFEGIDSAAIDALRQNGELDRAWSFTRVRRMFGRQCILRFSDGQASIDVEWLDVEARTVRRMRLRSLPSSVTEVRIQLEPPARRLRARVVREGLGATGDVRFGVRVDGREVVHGMVGASALALDVDCAGARNLTLSLTSANAPPKGLWIALEDVQLE